MKKKSKNMQAFLQICLTGIFCKSPMSVVFIAFKIHKHVNEF